MGLIKEVSECMCVNGFEDPDHEIRTAAETHNRKVAIWIESRLDQGLLEKARSSALSLQASLRSQHKRLLAEPSSPQVEKNLKAVRAQEELVGEDLELIHMYRGGFKIQSADNYRYIQA